MNEPLRHGQRPQTLYAAPSVSSIIRAEVDDATEDQVDVNAVEMKEQIKYRRADGSERLANLPPTK